MLFYGTVLATILLAASWFHRGPEFGGPDFLIDSAFGIPTPPSATPYNALGNIAASALLGGIGLFCVLCAAIYSIRSKSVLPLAVALSGVLGVFPEVFVDVVGGVWYPTVPGNVVFEVLGRKMPYWSLFIWFGYTSIIYFAFRQLENNPATRTLWLLWGGALAVNLVLEEALLNIFPGLYHYYGNQPLVAVLKLPLWWLPCNSLGIMLVVSLAYRFRAALGGWRAWLLLPVMPGCLLAVYGFVALPSWIVVNGHYSWAVTQLGGLATLALGVVAFCLILRLVLERDPFDMAGRGVSGHAARP